MNTFLRIAVAVGVAVGLLGFGGGHATAADKGSTNRPANTDTVPVANANKRTPAKEILFFMNPNGHPCQMQNAILESIKDSLAGLATITYIKTTDPKNQDAFETYGIRGLPSLIIVDKNGKELKRFTPGIHSKEDILAALRKKVK